MPASARCRLALTATRCLAGGAAATVVVAWGFGLWGRTTKIATHSISPGPNGQFDLQGLGHLGRLLNPDAAQYTHSMPLIDLVAEEARGCGVAGGIVWANSFDGDLEHGYPAAMMLQAGWPLIAMQCKTTERPDQRSIWVGALPVPRWLARGSSSPLWPGESPSLPMCPMWPGFAADSLFYAALLATLFLAPPRFRRALRLRRGLCPACAYDLTSNTTGVCSECGKKLVPAPV